MRHNGATLPDVIGDEAWVKFDNQLKSKRACKLPSWFFNDKTIKLGPVDNGRLLLKFDKNFKINLNFTFRLISLKKTRL